MISYCHLFLCYVKIICLIDLQLFGYIDNKMFLIHIRYFTFPSKQTNIQCSPHLSNH